MFVTNREKYENRKGDVVAAKTTTELNVCKKVI